MNNAEAWRAGELLSGIVWLNSKSSDSYIPQMLGFENIGAVSFRKGCYPGQEIVARARYLGKVKRKPLVATIEGTPALDIGGLVDNGAIAIEIDEPFAEAVAGQGGSAAWKLDPVPTLIAVYDTSNACLGVLNGDLATITSVDPDRRSEVEALVAPFVKLADPELILFADAGDQTVAFFPGIGDMNEVLKHVNGLRYPWDYVKLWWHARRQPECLAVKSVLILPEYWGTGVGVLLMAALGHFLGLTTAIGFLALATVRIQAVRELGTLGGLGVLCVLGAVLTLVPAALADQRLHIHVVRLRPPLLAIDLDARRVHHQALDSPPLERPVNPKPIPPRFVHAH